MGGPDGYAAFAELMAQPDPPLDRALALVAAAGRAGVDPDRILGALDDLADHCTSSGPSSPDPAALCGWLFGRDGGEGFVGDRHDYYDLRNSLLDEVLARRCGIPISLAAVAIEVGRRCDVGLVGIGMPGHFLVRSAAEPDEYFDVFDAGRPLDRAGCRARFHELHGPGPAFAEEFLEPTPTPRIVARVLNNLMGAARRAGDRSALTRALRLGAALADPSVAGRRQLAGSLAAAGRFAEAAALHDELARLDPQDAARHAAAALQLRARLN